MKNFLLILLFNISILLGIEVVFRILDLEPKKTFFIEGDQSGVLVANQAHFNPLNNFAINDSRITKEKKKDHLRVFMVGGSTIAGLHFNPHASMAHWLKEGFQEIAPKKNIEVINAGMGGKGSHEVLEVVKECLNYDPDLFIIYTGQNEFLEPNIYRFRRQRLQPRKVKLRNMLQKSAAISWVFYKAERWGKEMSIKSFGKSKMISTSIAGDDFPAILDAYEKNVRTIAQLANDQEIPVMLLTPFNNVRNWAPNTSYFSKPVSEEKKIQFENLINKARTEIEKKRFYAARRTIQEAEAIDSEVAEVFWQNAKIFDHLGYWAKAGAAYEKAIDLDGKPWRNLSSFPKKIREISKEENVLLFDSQKHLEDQSPNGLIGDSWIIDNCHPNLKGQYTLAKGILTTLKKNEVLLEKDLWKDTFLSKPYVEYLPHFFPDAKILAETHLRTSKYNLNWVSLRYESHHRLKKALVSIEKALEVRPNYPEALFLKGLILSIQGNPSRGNELIANANKIDPEVSQQLKNYKDLLSLEE